jgi:hypothetical protein
MSRLASVQAVRVGLEAIEDAVVRLTGAHHRAVLEVGAVDFALQGEVELEALVAGFAAFLNGLTHPIQVLVRVLPVDLDAYLGRLEARARELPAALARLALDHAAFVRGLAREHTQLERRFYIVVPADAPARPAGSWPRLLWPFGRRPDRGPDAAAARRQLAFRCAEVARQLGRCGLPVRRLDTLELARLFHECWCPELSRIQRIRLALVEYLAPVVTARRPLGRAA